MIEIEGFTYVPSTPGTLLQGVKNHQTPKGAVAGSNGSFIMCGLPPQILVYYTENNTPMCTNLYPFIKDNTSRRVTKKFATEICNSLMNNNNSECCFAKPKAP